MPVSVAQADIQKVWRPLTPDEVTLVPGLSSRAWIRVLAALPYVEEQAAPEVIRDVMVSMIVRVLKNPESLRRHAEAIDDFNDSKELDPVISSGEMYLLPSEIAMLTPAAEAPVYGMYVMGLGG